jgi:YVTN family beta-propeller protein
MNAAGTGALAERAQPPAAALAPPLSTPMTSPAGSLASTIGADNTAISPDGRLVTPAGRTIVTDAFSNNVVLSRDGTRIYTSSEAVSNDPQNDKGNTRHFSVIDPQTLNRVRIRDDDIQYGLAETPDGKQLYVSEAGKNSVGVFDTAGFGKLASIALGSRDFPWGLAIHPGGRYAYAVGYRSNTLDVIDTQTRTMVGQPGTGEHPYGVVISPDGKRDLDLRPHQPGRAGSHYQDQHRRAGRSLRGFEREPALWHGALTRQQDARRDRLQP